MIISENCSKRKKVVNSQLVNKAAIFALSIPVSIAFGSLYPVEGFAKPQKEEKRAPVINVMSSDSLGNLVSDLARVYSRKSKIRLSINFGNPPDLVKRISEGSSADLFITEDPEWINNLKIQGLVDLYNVIDIGSTTLDMICGGEEASDKSFNKVMSSVGASFKLAICNSDTCELGKYSKKLISNYQLESRLDNNTTEVSTVESVVSVVESENKCGLIYNFNWGQFKHGKLWKVELDPSKQPEIKIKAAVIAGENMEEARGFIEFLKTRQAKEVIEKNGLTYQN